MSIIKKSVNDFIEQLETEFKRNANPEIAVGQKAYMKNKFEFYGIKTPLRREIQRPFLDKKYLPSKKEIQKIIKTLWLKPEREYQYFAQELTYKYVKLFEKKDIELFEFMIIHGSWWDSIDFIASNLLGEYFKLYPKQTDKYMKKWMASKNIWLQRSAILFQLKYKNKLDTVLLVSIINSLLGSKEFFINKAIGWILREYSKTNPKWVVEFCKKTELQKLSRYEALRLIK